MTFNLAIAQISTLAGQIEHNTKKIIQTIKDSKARGATVIAFPELTIPGYAAMDLFFDPIFIRKNRYALEDIAIHCEGITAIVGFAEYKFGRLYNSAAIISNGKEIITTQKILIPNYDVFDESRYFSPRSIVEEALVVEIEGKKVGIQICEDMWNESYLRNPTFEQRHADIIINISASPYYIGKTEERLNIIRDHVTNIKAPFVYVNMIGSQDGYDGELIFDGNSLIVSKNTKIIDRLYSQEGILVVGEDKLFSDPVSNVLGDKLVEDEIIDSLVIGIQSYFDRCGFDIALIGLSGGIDSAVVATLATMALKAENVIGITMPSDFSSESSVEDSLELARNLGIRCITLPISNTVETISSDLYNLKHFNISEDSLTLENVQARIRGLMLMAFSNKFNGLVLSTGNKTEMALGYCTLYGDTAGGLAVIGDVNKQMVYRIANHLNSYGSMVVVPRRTITKPPSAELKPNQTDEASLGASYDVISPLVDDIIENNLSERELYKKYPSDIVNRCVKLVKRAEYKRRQMAPSIKISKKAFGIGRRFPIVY